MSGEPTPLQRAIAALEKMKARLDAAERAAVEPIAIIGLGCHFPGGGEGPEAFFRALEEGVDAVREIPAERWPAEAIPGRRPEVRWAALLEEVSGFDACFFGISPREAESLDPQQRMLLEVAWEALEDAGQPAGTLMGSKTGVFVGMCSNDYHRIVADARAGHYDAYCATGTVMNTAAGRVSFVLGLQGPCLALDTACSSSLVAVAQACQSLRAGDSDLALAGGVNLVLSPLSMAMLAETQALSPDGRCKTLDARANGFVRGEGGGLVVLKRLSDALRDGDRIRASIRGWAVNQDGRSTGLTTPNVLSQQAMLEQALARARVSPEDIGYLEMHGTGTSLGDPIEAEALREVLGKPRPDGSACVLGAVKTNVGHLEGAAGVAGLIKVVLAMEHGKIPRNLHFRRLNPRISLEGTPFVIPTTNVPWERGSKPRLAGVSAFGMSGTNAHVVLEEAPLPPKKEMPVPSSARLLPLSAKSPEALRSLARAYATRLASLDGDALTDIVYTASARRTHHAHRIGVVGGDGAQIGAALEAFARGEPAAGVAHGKAPAQGAPRLVYVFSGQGSQWAGMGQRLLAESPVFRAKLEECDALLQRHVSWSLLDELAAPEGRSRLDETQIAQPALLAIQVAIAELLKSWGVTPGAVVGHSVGEIAAAHVSGALALEEAIRLAALRGRIMQKATGLGKMAWVGLPEAEAARAIAGKEDRLAIAAVNDPGSVVLSGEGAALEEVVATLAGRGVIVRPLRVSYAFHSPQMEPLAREFVAALGRVEARAATIPMYSTVTGALLGGESLDAAYWGRNVRQTVELSRAVAAALADEGRSLLEVGPHPALVVNLQQCVAGRPGAHVVASLRRQGEELRAMLTALAELYAHGLEIDWERLHPAGGRCVPLPAYPWQRERYWIDGVWARPPASLARDPLDDWLYEVQWRPRERPARAAEVAALPEAAWLLFADGAGVAARLAETLRARGEPCVLVARGERFEKIAPGHYRINSREPGDYPRILAEEFAGKRRCLGALHFFGLDTTPWSETTESSLEADQREGFLSGAHLAQALLKYGSADKPPLWLFTRGAQAAGARPVSAIAQAPLWGLGRTIALEHPELDCRCVDLDPTTYPGESERIFEELHASDQEHQVALRQEGRLVARLARASSETQAARAFVPDPAASYLITGGLGGLGLSVARWLADKGARHIVLMGRRGPSAEAEDAIRAMEAAGVRVLVMTADVSRRADVERVLAEIARQGLSLRGVVHAAGVVSEPTPLLSLGEGSFQRVMAPKLVGAWNLHEATRSMPLDFFVLYSSASAVLGLTAQASYAAANASLDALARARAAKGLVAMSIQWGPFSEVGIGAARENRAERPADRGLDSFTPEEGTRLLQRLLERPRAEVSALRLSARRWAELFPQVAQRPFFSELLGAEQPAQAPAPAFLDELQRAPRGDWRELLARHVAEQLGQVLHADASGVDPAAPFSTLGMDSLMSLELRNRLQASLRLELGATLLFAYPTIEALSGYLLDTLAGRAARARAPLPDENAEAAPSAEQRSEEDAEALLEAKLSKLSKYLE